MEAPVFEISRIPSLTGLRLSGELDLCSSPELSAALAEIGADDPIHIDLSELTFLDSAGMNEILSLAGSRSGRGRVVLMNPSEPVRRALEIGGLDAHSAIEILLPASSMQSRFTVGVARQSATSEAAW